MVQHISTFSRMWNSKDWSYTFTQELHTRFQSVIGQAQTEWSGTTMISPGVRWAYNLKNDLQIVPGVAVPLGVGASAGERGIFLYLSFEHPFTTGN